MREMTDWDATIGAWRARTCEWIFNIDTPERYDCGKPVAPGRPYCDDCHKLAYRSHAQYKKDKLAQ